LKSDEHFAVDASIFLGTTGVSKKTPEVAFDRIYGI
jgi:hypothetical protein